VTVKNVSNLAASVQARLQNHVASDTASGCIGMRLYLPEQWASDIARRRGRRSRRRGLQAQVGDRH
jgi:hypothetical protein